MKKLVLSIVITLGLSNLFSQSPKFDELIHKGQIAHDKMDYELALTYYDSVLQIDSNYNIAIIEKAFTLNELYRYEESIDYCEKALSVEPNIEMEYITYGNTLDLIEKHKEAISIYNLGLERFPNNIGLLYNKGVALMSLKEYDKAESFFQSVLILDPLHYNSYRSIAMINNQKNMGVSLLCYIKMNIEYPNSEFAEENYLNALEICYRWTKIKKHNVKPEISKKFIKDWYDGYTNTYENNFKSIIGTILLYITEYQNNFEPLHSIEDTYKILEIIHNTIKDDRNSQFGFYWELMGNYFNSLGDHEIIETASYVSCLWANEKRVTDWTANNYENIDKLNTWIILTNGNYHNYMINREMGSTPPKD